MDVTMMLLDDADPRLVRVTWVKSRLTVDIQGSQIMETLTAGWQPCLVLSGIGRKAGRQPVRSNAGWGHRLLPCHETNVDRRNVEE